jgi:hypothetical protein
MEKKNTCLYACGVPQDEYQRRGYDVIAVVWEPRGGVVLVDLFEVGPLYLVVEFRGHVVHRRHHFVDESRDAVQDRGVGNLLRCDCGTPPARSRQRSGATRRFSRHGFLVFVPGKNGDIELLDKGCG